MGSTAVKPGNPPKLDPTPSTTQLRTFSKLYVGLPTTTFTNSGFYNNWLTNSSSSEAENSRMLTPTLSNKLAIMDRLYMAINAA